jgi:hypothetical protein
MIELDSAQNDKYGFGFDQLPDWQEPTGSCWSVICCKELRRLIMITHHRFGNRRLLSAFVGIVFALSMLGNPLAALAAGWSSEVTVLHLQQSVAQNAVAMNPSGNEVWVTSSLANFVVTVQAAQRSFGGTWSSLTTVATQGPSIQGLSVALSANNYAAAIWLAGGGVNIALRSPAGVWQAPVSFAQTGGASNLVAKLDAQGNGVAVWSRLTATASLVEAVTWTANGTFGSVIQLSPTSHGAFAPDIAINEAGTAVVVWLASAPRDNSNPYQVESATRPAGGTWSAVTTVSPVVPQTWAPRVALDGSGNATAVWMTATTLDSERIYAATRPAGGTWGSQARIEPSDWRAVSEDTVNADAAGNVTATWVVQDSMGNQSVRAASLPIGGAWGAPTTLGQCRTVTSYCLHQVSVARDGSIAVVGWGAYGPTLFNAAVRLGLGAWTPMVVGSNNPALSSVVTASNAHASAVWQAPIGVRYKVDFRQSDYQ